MPRIPPPTHPVLPGLLPVPHTVLPGIQKLLYSEYFRLRTVINRDASWSTHCSAMDTSTPRTALPRTQPIPHHALSWRLPTSHTDLPRLPGSTHTPLSPRHVLLFLLYRPLYPEFSPLHTLLYGGYFLLRTLSTGDTSGSTQCSPEDTSYLSYSTHCSL